ncbi:MAG: hypothetical protein PHI24_09065 [Desulfitobacteriaceae bacterium]|nr:hypothetical protein [Desulfitobacteriaceae bacterium]
MAKIIALIGPSGAGKSTIAYTLGLEPIISMTTRQPRSGELHGRDYYFVSKEDYLYALENDRLVEHVENYGNFYGVPKAELSNALLSDIPHYVIVTYAGLKKLKETLPDDTIISIFIYAPLDDITSRLKRRILEGDITRENAARRLALYKDELNTAQYCDFIVPSLEGWLDKTINLVKLIVDTCN